MDPPSGRAGATDSAAGPAPGNEAPPTGALEPPRADPPGHRSTPLADLIGMVVGSNFLNAVLGLVQGVLLVRLLPKQDYGIWAFLMLLFGTGRDLGQLAVPESVLYFASKIGRPELRGLVRQSARVLAGLGALVALVLAALAIRPDLFLGGREGLTAMLLLVGVATLFAFPASIYASVFIATDNHRAAASLSLFIAVTSTAALVVPAALGLRLEWMVGLFAAVLALRLVLSEWLFRTLFRGVPTAPFPGGIREQLRYSVPLGVTRIAGIFNQKLDKFTVGLFFSASAFAEFAVASQELPLVSILPYSIAQILLPKLVEHYERGASRLEGARAAVELWKVGIRKATLVMVPVAAFLLTMAEPLMESLYGARYRGAALPFRVYTSLLPLRVTAYGIMLMAFGQTARILRSQIYGMVFNVIANITLLSLLGMIGAPLAAVLTQAFMIVYLVSRIDQVARVGIRGIFPWSFYARVALAACAGAAPLVAGVLLLPRSTPPVVLVLAGIPVFVAVYLLVANATGVLAEEDRAYVMRWLRLEPLRKPRRGSP